MKKTLRILLIIVFVVAAFSAWKVLGPSVSAPQDKFFYIRSGSGFNEMRDELISKKIISSAQWFDWLSAGMGFRTARAGKYEIKKGMSLFELVRLLKNGRQTPVKLVITKLRLKEDFAKKLGQQFEFDSLAAMQFLTNNDSLKTFGLDTNTVLAAVMPDTYSYYWNSDPKKVYQKLFDHWQKFWTDDRKSRAGKQGLTPVQVTILASIVDEESNHAPEKGTMASVYINRLKNNMRLQADPTVKFALKDFTLKRIYEKHLTVQSPYNTYMNAGLPPGPVCTPQPETIDMVLNAPQTDYLYFVANSDFSGTHVYSKNYDDHLKLAKEFARAQDRQDSIRKANR
ncbi:MAG TPA: endolytic transglycosylase MltG [Chitinophagaceae bacterium]|nr:endolytic transglycosylase MltG [Chitinophagaceae bacterium]